MVVCKTEVEDLSRMCIVLKGQDGVVEQARRQLEDLVSRHPSIFFEHICKLNNAYVQFKRTRRFRSGPSWITPTLPLSSESCFWSRSPLLGKELFFLYLFFFPLFVGRRHRSETDVPGTTGQNTLNPSYQPDLPSTHRPTCPLSRPKEARRPSFNPNTPPPSTPTSTTRPLPPTRCSPSPRRSSDSLSTWPLSRHSPISSAVERLTSARPV